MGVGPGWRCLEVGAGAGSIARALSAVVGAGGSVLATDIDLRFLAGAHETNLEVRAHDITTDPLPPAEFDLAHARGVLEHIGETPARALARMVDAIRPGGVVVVEDPDWSVFDAQELPPSFGVVHRRLRDAYIAATGYDPTLGLRLPGLLRAAGLVEVEASAHVSTMYGGTPSMEWYVLGIDRALPALIEAGVLDQDLADAALAEVRDPTCTLLSPLRVAAWARKPS